MARRAEGSKGRNSTGNRSTARGRKRGAGRKGITSKKRASKGKRSAKGRRATKGPRTAKGRGRPSRSRAKRKGSVGAVKGSELRSRIVEEKRKTKAIERKIAERDRDLQDLEKRLNTLTVKYRQSRDGPKRGPGPDDGGQPRSMEAINTTTDERIDSVDDVDEGYIKGIEVQKRLLEDRLEKEEAELALLAKLVELEERDKVLAERESALDEIEKELEEEVSSSSFKDEVDEIKKNLMERYRILERRNRRLDMIEEQLDKLEVFVNDQEEVLGRIRRGRKGRRTLPRRRRRRKGGSSEEE